MADKLVTTKVTAQALHRLRYMSGVTQETQAEIADRAIARELARMKREKNVQPPAEIDTQETADDNAS